jgi:hypothetical protein
LFFPTLLQHDLFPEWSQADFSNPETRDAERYSDDCAAEDYSCDNGADPKPYTGKDHPDYIQQERTGPSIFARRNILAKWEEREHRNPK